MKGKNQGWLKAIIFLIQHLMSGEEPNVIISV
jgi:hypothetical protein